MIATPIYSECVPDFSKSVLSAVFMLAKNGIAAEWAPFVGCCYVHTARNKLVQLFRQRKFDELLFWDADIGAEPEDVLKLCQHKREIVGGAAPFRFGTYKGFPAETVRDAEGFPMGLIEEGLIEASVIPTAMLKISASVFDTLEQKGLAPLRIEWSRQTNEEFMRWRSFFDFEADEEHHVEYGEDVSFCRKCQKAGYQLWIEPRMTLRHYGSHYRKGNLDEFLREKGD